MKPLGPHSCILAVLVAAMAACERPSPSVKVVSAASKFLATLSEPQRQAVTFDFHDAKQRARWSNFPTGVVPRSGIRFKDMTPVQRAAAMDLLATMLSPTGLEKIERIRQADDVFRGVAGKHGPGGHPGGPRPDGPRGPEGPSAGRPGGLPTGRSEAPGGPGGPPPDFGAPHPPFSPDDLFGRDLYYFSFLGAPSTTTPWIVQFGGHHLALNITVAGTRNVLTPTLTGAQPASFVVNGQTIRPLGGESDKAFALLQSLDGKERGQAVLGYQIADLVLGPGQDGKKIVPEGLKASDMNTHQRALLLDVLAEWTGILNEASASPRMAELRADLPETWFAWSGPTSVEPGANITAYYRIQGPRVVLEYAPQNDEPANHVHTMYRDPTDDYGQRLSP